MRRVGIKRSSSMEIGSWDLPQSKRRRVDERPRRGGALWSGLTATLGGIVSVVRGWFRRRPITMSDSPQKSEEPLPSSPHSSTHSPPRSLCPPPHSPSSPPHSPSSPPTPSPPHSLSQMTHLPAHQPTSAHTVISQPLQPPITSHTIRHSTSRTPEMLWSKPVSGKASILHQWQQAQHGMDPPTPPSASNSLLAPLSWTTGAHTSSDSLLIPSLDTAGPENIGPRLRGRLSFHTFATPSTFDGPHSIPRRLTPTPVVPIRAHSTVGKVSHSTAVLPHSPPLSPLPLTKATHRDVMRRRKWVESVKADHIHSLTQHREAVERELKRLAECRENRFHAEDSRVRRLQDSVRNMSLLSDISLEEEEEEEEEEEMAEMSDEQELQVRQVLSQGSGMEVLSQRFNISIKRADIGTLSGLNWLNDEVINFYMNLIVDRGQSASSVCRVHAMSSFFYPKLREVGYSGVRRWTKKVDIFSMDLVLYPIHLGSHWCLATIDNNHHTLSYYDSLGGSGSTCLTVLREYLVAEHRDKKKCELSLQGWSDVVPQGIPQQRNGSDCGVFTCMVNGSGTLEGTTSITGTLSFILSSPLTQYARYLARNLPFTFSQDDMPQIRRHIICELLEQRLF